MAKFTEITSSTAKSYLNSGSWSTFSQNFSTSQFDGLQFQTGSQDFYLKYRTYNKGYGWYPFVTSKVNEYAGSSGKNVEAIQIQVYNNSGTKIDKGFIVMYRAYTEYNWLGWVSNATPDKMEMIRDQFGLDGALDRTGSNSGLPGNGIPISRFEIRIFEEDLSVDPGDIPTSVTNGVSQSYMVNDVWNALTSSISSTMHGIRIQTTAKPYYLKYRTYNTGHGWYPDVLSNDTSGEAYAGSSGKAIEGIQIQVYDNAGAKLSKTFVVMYRVFVDGNWLSWVSNAPYDIMQSLQADANLGGSLDGNSSNAGYPGTGKTITQIDIRVFEYVKEPSNNYPAATGEFSQLYHSGGTWYALTANTYVSSMDGVKLTTSSSNFSIKYRTYSTETGWLPYVSSTSTDYAGSLGKAIEAAQIQVYDSNNVKLDNTYVIMYRAYANGKWLDWVSNASPEKMKELLERDKLDGNLDTAGAYAGIKGTSLNKLQIRFYPNEPVIVPSETTIEKLAMSYMVGGSSSWTTFEDRAMVPQMDGIKIRTSADKSYYLQYRTFNSGKTNWYPYVKSTVEDYAGSAGKAIQRLQIQAYKNDGTKLSSGVIVMYRAYVSGEWLPWVSNANKACMEFVQEKYSLSGGVDTAGSYAGISGKSIAGVEIRVYVDDTIPTVPTTPTGEYKIIQAPFFSQLGTYPTGCESVSSVMALNYAGINISVDNFIDSYLDTSSFPFDPNLSFGGDPRTTYGYGCYAPVIKKAMNKVLSERNYTAEIPNNLSLNELCTRYIDNDIPVILWATMYMNTPKAGNSWVYNETRINWIVPEHCLLLVGYDENNYIFNDPLQTSAQTYYSKASVEAAYLGLHCQAVVLVEKTEKSLDELDREILKGNNFFGQYFNEWIKTQEFYEQFTNYFKDSYDDYRTILALKLLAFYYSSQFDKEKVNDLYREMIKIRRIDEQYRNKYTNYMDTQGYFSSENLFNSPKTCQFTYEALCFTKQDIIDMHNLDSFVFTLFSFFGVPGQVVSLLGGMYNKLYQNGTIDAESDFKSIMEASYDYITGELLEEAYDQGMISKKIKSLFGAGEILKSLIDLNEQFESESRESYRLDNGLRIQEGDSCVTINVRYAFGLEYQKFVIYLRGDAPLGMFYMPIFRQDKTSEIQPGVLEEEGIKKLHEIWTGNGFSDSEISHPTLENDKYPFRLTKIF